MREGDLEPPALLADQVLRRHEDVGELGDRVLDPLQPHERVAVQDLHARRVAGQDEGADAAAVALGLRHARHHDDDVGDHAVGRPQLGAVELVAALDGLGGRRHARGVGADVGLGQQEGRDVGARHARQPLALLLVGAEHPQRLGDADRLVRGDQRAERGVPGADHRQRAVVVDLREPEAAVLLGDLHPHRADPLEPLDDLVGDLRLALDQQRVDLVLEELAERREEALALLGRLGVEPRLRVDQVQPVVAEEELLAEAREFPFLLARGFGDLPCLAFADVRRSHLLITAQLRGPRTAFDRAMRPLLVLLALLVLAAPAHAAGPRARASPTTGILLAGGPEADQAGQRLGERWASSRSASRAVVADRGPEPGGAEAVGASSTAPSTASSAPGMEPMLTITGPGPLWTSRRAERGDPRYDPDPERVRGLRERGRRPLRRPRGHATSSGTSRTSARGCARRPSCSRRAARRSRRTCTARSCAPPTRRCTPPTPGATGPDRHDVLARRRAQRARTRPHRPLAFLRALGCVDSKLQEACAAAAARASSPPPATASRSTRTAS